jgi:pimeloyl-ACP methyl ester carboxylesterase
VLWLLGSAAAADARTAWHACDHGKLDCARVSAPLDPTGRVPGRVSLFVERYLAAQHATSTILALAGGPGQSGADLLPRFRDGFSAELGTRALVTFDERGVGRSGQLDCRIPVNDGLSGRRITTCAHALGRRARFYTTADTVSDIETIRRKLGLGRIDLYGVSYGTFPATQYARRYPSRVAHLVLDSPLPADGDVDVNLDSFASARRQLASICPIACPTLNPGADLDALLARLPPTISKSHGLALTRDDAGRLVLNALDGADLDPFVRASIPAALRLAAGGDTSAIVRLGDLAVASEQAEATAGVTSPTASAHPASVAVDVEPIATRCEDQRFAWSSDDPLALRRSDVRREESRLSPAALAPFSPPVAIAEAVISVCDRWPDAGSRPPREPGPLPAVPTLILSGENDVRTPLEQAATLAGQIPGATLLKVPNVGHAVLADDHSDCAKRAVAAFLNAASVIPCAPSPPPPVDPLPPASLASLAPAAPLTGEPGVVLRASVLTLRHDVDLVAPYFTTGLVVAGTVGGRLADRSVAGRDSVLLDEISYVRSVALNGTLKLGRGSAAGRLRVKVSGRVYGMLSLAADGTITGSLAGRTFKLSSAAQQAIDTAGGLDFATRLR